MKILIVTQYYWPENFRINDLTLELQNKKHDVTVLTGKPNYPSGRFFKNYNFFNKRKENNNGIKIIRCPIIPRGNGSSIKLLFNYVSFVIFASFAAIFRIKGQFDVIFVFEPSPITVGLPAILLKRLKKSPMFFWVQDLWPESITAAGNIKSKLILRMIGKIVHIIYKESDIILLSSRGFRSSVEKYVNEKNKITYFPNWAEEIYSGKFSNETKLTKLLPKGFIIMFAGNIGDAQDFESILEAARNIENKDIHWVILGDGRKKEWVRKKVSEYNLINNFHLLGRFPMEKMPLFFNSADALLISLKNESIFSTTVPSKLQSYLAFGKPILGMLNGEGAEIIKESASGLTCNAEDSTGLVKNIKKLYSLNSETLKIMGENGKKYYLENFSRQKLLAKFDEILSENISMKAK